MMRRVVLSLVLSVALLLGIPQAVASGASPASAGGGAAEPAGASYDVVRGVCVDGELLLRTSSTPVVAVDGYTLEATDRYQTPYGETRGSDPQTWPDEYRFLNKPHDAGTGLSSVGARQYDPVTGRFISVDPVLEPTSPAQSLGYSYANNNPMAFDDPTGLRYADDRIELGGTENDPYKGHYAEMQKYFPQDNTPRPSGPERCKACDVIGKTVQGTKAFISHPIKTTVDVTVATYESYRGCAQQLTFGACQDVAIDVGLAIATYGVGTAIKKAHRAGQIADAKKVPDGKRKTPSTAAETADETVDAYTHGYKYHPRIRQRGLEDPRAHNFPYSFDDVILRQKPTTQADGSLLYRKVGEINAKSGTYEIAVNPDTGVIFHRSWKP